MDEQQQDDVAEFARQIAASTSYARKEIYAHMPGSSDATAFILVGYCKPRFAYFQAMIALAKQSFPDINEFDLKMGTVINSDIVKGYTYISFPVPNKPVRGWRHYDFPEHFS